MTMCDVSHISASPAALVAPHVSQQPPNHRGFHMRKYILIAAMVLVSATAQAGVSRGLTLASNDEPAISEQPKAVEAPKSVDAAKPAETPKYVERPAAGDTTTPAPQADQAKPADKSI